MIRTKMNRDDKPSSNKGVRTREFRRAVKAIMRRKKVDYDEAVSILKQTGLRPSFGKFRDQAAGHAGKHQPT